MIAKKDLVKGRWYLGCGRGSQVAQWDGGQFQWVGDEWGLPAVQSGKHYEEGGCFLPMEEISSDRYPTVAEYGRDETASRKG